MLSEKTILIVDDDDTLLEILEDRFKKEGYSVISCRGSKEATEGINNHVIHAAILDLVLPDGHGFDVLEYLKELNPNCPIIILTGHATISTAVDAIKKGAYDYLTKPVSFEELHRKLKQAMEMYELRRENVVLRAKIEERCQFERMIGKSDVMQKLYRIIERVAATDATVLITGESGTGKELVAHAIHRLSKRRDKPFVPINCGAIPEELLESELFGHEKGAFSGAFRTRPGRFEIADGGTVFLDEIGEMSLKLQVKLLRFLQDRKFERVGGTRTIKVNIRVIAATNRNLWEAVKKGSFREDLYYRLNVIPIHVPPLRERKEDIPLLVEHFLSRHCQTKGIPLKNIQSEVLQCFERYSWPGNVRELENLMERLVILSEGNEITLHDLPDRFLTKEERGSAPFRIKLDEKGIRLKEMLESIERDLILQALERTGGVKNKAAKLLGLNRTTLIEKIKKFKIQYPS